MSYNGQVYHTAVPQFPKPEIAQLLEEEERRLLAVLRFQTWTPYKYLLHFSGGHMHAHLKPQLPTCQKVLPLQFQCSLLPEL